MYSPCYELELFSFNVVSFFIDLYSDMYCPFSSFLNYTQIICSWLFKRKGEECLDENHQIPNTQTTSQYIYIYIYVHMTDSKIQTPNQTKIHLWLISTIKCISTVLNWEIWSSVALNLSLAPEKSINPFHVHTAICLQCANSYNKNRIITEHFRILYGWQWELETYWQHCPLVLHIFQN